LKSCSEKDSASTTPSMAALGGQKLYAGHTIMERSARAIKERPPRPPRALPAALPPLPPTLAFFTSTFQMLLEVFSFASVPGRTHEAAFKNGGSGGERFRARFSRMPAANFRQCDSFARGPAPLSSCSSATAFASFASTLLNHRGFRMPCGWGRISSGSALFSSHQVTQKVLRSTSRSSRVARLKAAFASAFNSFRSCCHIQYFISSSRSHWRFLEMKAARSLRCMPGKASRQRHGKMSWAILLVSMCIFARCTL